MAISSKILKLIVPAAFGLLVIAIGLFVVLENSSETPAQETPGTASTTETPTAPDASGLAAADANGDGNVTVNELVLAVNAALRGCPV